MITEAALDPLPIIDTDADQMPLTLGEMTVEAMDFPIAKRTEAGWSPVVAES